MKTFTLVLIVFAAGSLLYAQDTPVGSPHGPLALACNDCHTTTGWRPIQANPLFNHHTTKFPLEGRHVEVQCISCHTNLVFSKAGMQCRDCHTDVHRGQFAVACSECHTPRQWNNEREMAQRHQQTRFPLSGVHAGVDCQACHATGQYAGVSTDCGACHLATFRSTTNPNHNAAGFSTDCSRCHNVVKAGWQNASFDHATSGFPLTGQHQGAACASCHTVNGQTQYSGISTDCYFCHASNYQNAADPNHVSGNFGHACAVCHSTSGWHPASFDHNASPFPLTGAHQSVECASCHTLNGQTRYTGTPQDCYSCHQTNFQNSTNPNHAASNFPHECTQCHTTAGWRPATFDHNLSSFPLTGAHTSVQCAQCHTNGQFANTPSDCYTCHQAAFDNSTNPNHASQNFPHECLSCHNTAAWQPSTFDHAASSFPLTGAHVNAQCAQCHVNGQFANTPVDCYTCHQTDFGNSTNPNHAAQNFPHDCTQCHNTAAWQPSTFNHAASSFPLTGAHANAQCAQCHVNGQFANTPTDCYTCHQTDYQGANNPNHAAQNFPHDCTMCHTTSAWQPSSFNHASTAFPLTGRHTSVQCTQCHVNGQYAGTPTDCYSCHRPDYEGVTDPNHVALNYSHDCTQCHNTNGWGDGGGFNHSNTTFPLTGAHQGTACNLCHVGGHYTGTPTDCYACHQGNYDGSTNPNHAANQFDHNCQGCHNTAGWTPSTFDHSQSVFHLTGAHVSAACNLCHVNGVYHGTPQDCYTCHRTNYEGASNPNHVTNQFDHNCVLCHSTGAWSPSTFNHGNTSFPLTGAHLTTACNLCHINGQYHGTPTDCFFCHQTDYNNTINPNHAGAGFPHTCQTCHTTSTWDGATFNHDGPYFPIYSGRHQGTWTSCADCHTNPNNYAVFSCVTCHEHSQSQMDAQHQGVAGYVYDSAHCLQCHPRGNGGGLNQAPQPRRIDR